MRLYLSSLQSVVRSNVPSATVADHSTNFPILDKRKNFGVRSICLNTTTSTQVMTKTSDAMTRYMMFHLFNTC